VATAAVLFPFDADANAALVLAEAEDDGARAAERKGDMEWCKKELLAPWGEGAAPSSSGVPRIDPEPVPPLPLPSAPPGSTLSGIVGCRPSAARDDILNRSDGAVARRTPSVVRRGTGAMGGEGNCCETDPFRTGPPSPSPRPAVVGGEEDLLSPRTVPSAPTVRRRSEDAAAELAANSADAAMEDMSMLDRLCWREERRRNAKGAPAAVAVVGACNAYKRGEFSWPSAAVTSYDNKGAMCSSCCCCSCWVASAEGSGPSWPEEAVVAEEADASDAACCGCGCCSCWRCFRRERFDSGSAGEQPPDPSGEDKGGSGDASSFQSTCPLPAPTRRPLLRAIASAPPKSSAP